MAHVYRCQSAWKLVELEERFRLFQRLRPDTVVDLAAAPGGFSQVALQKMQSRRDAAPPLVSPMVIAIDQRPIDPMPGLVVARGNILQHQRILETVRSAPLQHSSSPSPPTVTYMPSPARPARRPRRCVDAVLHDGVSVVKGQHTFSVTYAQNQMALSTLLLAGKLFQQLGPTQDTIAEDIRSPQSRKSSQTPARGSASPAMLPVCFVSKVLVSCHSPQVVAATRAMFRHVHTFKPPASRPESLETYVVATHFRLAEWERLCRPHRAASSPSAAALFSMPPAPEDCDGVERLLWNCLGCGRTCVGVQPCALCGSCTLAEGHSAGTRRTR
ncbi:FtsJ-like methyltransferase [Novymonas esmeraldas]|uniref:FtsJ-like methyltransferase n=1 Tax=Novymonas esmeraldas TaxID=1808958 RepID=A0AAW0EQP2_9TRYP